jgi:hypothetical protein
MAKSLHDQLASIALLSIGVDIVCWVT